VPGRRLRPRLIPTRRHRPCAGGDVHPSRPESPPPALLEEVSLADVPIAIKPLAKLANLRYVDLKGTAVKDFSPLAASAGATSWLTVPKDTPPAATKALTKANPKLDIKAE